MDHETHSHACLCGNTHEKLDDAGSLFLGFMGRPFDTDWTTTALRLAEATLMAKKDVTIWTCGYSTLITQRSLQRPVDPIHPESEKNGSVYALHEMAQSLIQTYPDTLRWYVCQYCMEERGATDQIEDVSILLPFSFNTYLNQAEQSLVFGVK